MSMRNKQREKRLGWVGHVMRRDKCNITHQAMALIVTRNRLITRPKLRWLDKIKEELKEVSAHVGDTQERESWRR